MKNHKATRHDHLSPEVRFRMKVGPKDSNGCRLWLAGLMADGYGTFTVRPGYVVRAHRYAYTLAKGKIPKGAVIMHLCDEPRCMAPAHLRAGTQSENMKDCSAKKRLSWKCWPVWSCGCTNVRVAVEEFDAECNLCGNHFEKKDK
jgi:hypothetical protein